MVEQICKTFGPNNFKWIDIPKGHVRCENCGGGGETSYMAGYGIPTSRYYEDCYHCGARGFVAAAPRHHE